MAKDDFYRKTFRGVYDNDRGGGRKPAKRAAYRQQLLTFLALVEGLEDDGPGRKVLTEQDWQAILELTARLNGVATPNLRISQQQSGSRGKRGEIVGNQRVNGS